MECPFDCEMYDFCECKKDGKCSNYISLNKWDTGGSLQACVVYSLPNTDTDFCRKIEVARFTNEQDALIASKAPYYLGLLKSIKMFGMTDTVKKALDNLD